MPSPVPSIPNDGFRPRDAERTKAEILAIATKEFSREGFAGARVDEIAARTSTTKRMIYYYFGGKEQLYVAVLENALTAVVPEAMLPDCTEPLDMVRELARRTFEQAQRHPELIRLIIVENMHGARYLSDSPQFRAVRKAGLGRLENALVEGVRQGTIRKGADPADVFMIINSFCSYRVANRFTFEQLTGCDLLDPGAEAHQRELLDDLLTSYLKPIV